MEEVKIEKASAADADVLQQIGRQTFTETFAASNDAGNLREYLEEAFSREKLTAELGNPDSCFYFALIGDKVVGYLKLNTGIAQTERQDEEAVEIERIYVLTDYHGRKVGQLLLNQAVRLAIGRQSPYVWLGVWEKNPRAIRFYQKNGFVAFDKHIFRLGAEVQTDIMMKKVLQEPKKLSV
ncbi:GNAT family N-acetyltransferase [Pedobacter sp. SYP-B3415]|uniref:GNAT family N-acetyltransferase n=1 Tax=Pedobacter sp. SYP-B3415 TaxID=2496641 RepID=UPI00101D53E8|nr:GNAT family N-acetyltransferase [Pedobacter sp. SYP-B3415]